MEMAWVDHRFLASTAQNSSSWTVLEFEMREDLALAAEMLSLPRMQNQACFPAAWVSLGLPEEARLDKIIYAFRPPETPSRPA